MNASTDETEAICREYAAKDKRIRYVRQAQNLGAAANFKYVLDEARGEYFMLCGQRQMISGIQDG
ncbi:glycosyltransferase [Thermosynechococcus sp. QS41]|uniref:glycosyltransferase n=1 Tax=Thermosynechococcus sp. QS41 TaxID=3074101 RepID=UPI0028F3FC7A|nr:glycosyltransferase [Thermosynechococcus sp. QS41]